MRYKTHQFNSEGLLSVHYSDHIHDPLDQIGTLYLDDKRGQKPLPVKQIAEMVNLQHFAINLLRNQDCKAFFEVLSHLPRLKELVITVEDGKHLLSAVGNLKTLEYLKISGKSLGEFPKEIEHLPNLRTLELGIYQWENIGRKSHLAALGGLPKLEELILDAKFNTPSGLGSLKQIKVLEARGLSSDLVGLSELTSLEDLTLGYGQCDASLRPTEGLRALKRLDVNSVRIAFPTSWAELVCLEELVLWSCNLPQVPDVISTIPNLRRLNIGRNQIKEIPKWICDFKRLEELRMSSNAIQVLPEGFANLQNLQKIKLDTNGLTAFPPAFLEMPGLREIHLCENKIAEIPVGPLNFPVLERIDLSHNRIAATPTALLELPTGEILLEGNTFVKAAGYKLDQVIQSVSQAGHTPEVRRTLLALAMGEISRALELATLPHLVAALNDPSGKLRAYAVDALHRFLPNPFEVGELPRSIQVLGHPASHQPIDYAKTLRDLGVLVNPQAPDGVEVVVLGEKPGIDVNAYLNAGAKAASFTQFLQFLESIEQPWLRSKAVTQPGLGENCRTLLESGTAENLRLAFAMIDSGGLPEQALSAALAISFFHSDPVLKEKAVKAFQSHASPATMAFLTANKRNHALMNPEKLESYVTQIAAQAGIDGHSFTKTAFRLHDQLLPCFVPYMTGPELETHCIQAGCLRLDPLPNGQLPKGVFELNQLDALDLSGLKLRVLPDGIDRIRGLRKLLLAGNMLTSLPETLGSCQHLETLDLAETAISALPQTLANLHSLRILSLPSVKFKDKPLTLAILQQLKGLQKIHHGGYPDREFVDQLRAILHHVQLMP